MKTSMKHISKFAKPAAQHWGKTSVVMMVVYVVLFGAWLTLQLHK